MWQAYLHWLSRRVLGTALLVAASLVGAAQVDVEGRVVSDVDSTALAGITVVVDGSSHGTATDANGYFRLRVDEPFPFALVFRGLGMAPHRVEIASMPGCDLHVCLHQENQNIGSVVVTAGVSARKVRLNTAVLRMVDKSLLTSRMAPSLSQTLGYVPGLHSMSIGNGMSKPMIRNMGFNRIAVIDRGIKQEGQQWGADHGLEFDQHAIAKLGIYKGPMSLQYGGDAMGGAIVINDDIPLPLEGVRGPQRQGRHPERPLIVNRPSCLSKLKYLTHRIIQESTKFTDYFLRDGAIHSFTNKELTSPQRRGTCPEARKVVATIADHTKRVLNPHTHRPQVRPIPKFAAPKSTTLPYSLFTALAIRKKGMF